MGRAYYRPQQISRANQRPMQSFSHVIIIYNPNSTGDSPQLARTFARQIRSKTKIPNVKLVETKHAGHAEELAYEAAKTHKNVLIVSVSGDGGYHEVVNGALRAVDEGSGQPVCAVLPGGNANDHYSSISRRPLIDALLDNAIAELDVLSVRVNKDQFYAHSYVGLGLTPLVAVELNRHTLSAVKESWLAIKTFHKFRPFTIEIEGKNQRFDSLVFANIDRMAKYLTLAENSKPNDGKFEIIRWPHAGKLKLLVSLLKAATSKGLETKTTNKVSFTCLKPMPIQLDGEITQLKAGDNVLVTSAHAKLRTLR